MDIIYVRFCTKDEEKIYSMLCKVSKWEHLYPHIQPDLIHRINKIRSEDKNITPLQGNI